VQKAVDLALGRLSESEADLKRLHSHTKDSQQRLARCEVKLSELERVKSVISSIKTNPSQLERTVRTTATRIRSELSSLIVANIPALSEAFCMKCLNLLWRGNRDGFGDAEFHRHCDVHGNTLTLIRDTKGNIFGGFTPVKRDSSGGHKSDRTQTGFLVTLKNPHNMPPKQFALKSERKETQYVVNPVDAIQFLAVAVTFPFEITAMQKPTVSGGEFGYACINVLDCLIQHSSLAQQTSQ
jgi:hypothetical protein